jgi:hypothetical protein
MIRGCRFYGFHPVPMAKILMPSMGNQCGLMTGSYSPCRMEVAGQVVDFLVCELRGCARAIEFDHFKRISPQIP